MPPQTQTLEAGLRKRWRYRGEAGAAAGAAAALAQALGVHELVARLLLQRGVEDAAGGAAFLEPKLTAMHDPALLPGAQAAAQRLSQAVAQRQPIVLYGDYDVDGVTGSAILWHVLSQEGAQVSTYVPHRLEEGYGLNNAAVSQIAAGEGGKTPLIVSIDCGITAIEPARLARAAGADLIITDHHQMDESLPDAFALVHPRLPGSKYPCGDICGAVVAYKLAWQFARVHCGSDRLPDPMRRLMLDLLSLAALGTVADVAPLRDECRVITRQGLGQIKRTSLPGLNAMIDAASLRDEKIDAYHAGFVLGPRLNACGRMGHAGKAVELFTEASPARAAEIAAFLTQENQRRQETDRVILDQALAMVEQEGYHGEDCRAIVLAREGWHPGVVGIVASRLVERFHRPVVMLCIDGDEAAGSARSVPGVSIHEALSHCGELLSSFGGHAMAAGLRLPRGRIDELRLRLEKFIHERLTGEEMQGVLEIDADCPLSQVSPRLWEQIQQLAPFGQANPAPLFCARDLQVGAPPQRVGNLGQHLKLLLRQGQRVVSAIGFQQGEFAPQLPAGARLDVVYEPKINTYRGQKNAEMHIRDIRLHGRSS